MTIRAPVTQSEVTVTPGYAIVCGDLTRASRGPVSQRRSSWQDPRHWHEVKLPLSTNDASRAVIDVQWLNEMLSGVVTAPDLTEGIRGFIRGADDDPAPEVVDGALTALRCARELGLEPYRAVLGADSEVSLWFRGSGVRAELDSVGGYRYVAMVEASGGDEGEFWEAHQGNGGLEACLLRIRTFLEPAETTLME